MAADSQYAVRSAVYSALTGHAGLTALVGSRVYDHVPPETPDGSVKTPFPYVVVGESTSAPWDTKDSDGMEIVLSIHTWSQYRGLKEAEQIMAQVIEALDQTALSVTGHTLVMCFFEFGDTLLDPDGLTRHGVQRFRITTET